MFEDSFVAARVDAGAGAGRTRWLAGGIARGLQGLCGGGRWLRCRCCIRSGWWRGWSAPAVFVPVKPVAPPKVVARESCAVGGCSGRATS